MQDRKTLSTYGYMKKAVTEVLWSFFMRKLDRLVADFPDTYKLIRQTDIDKTYSLPKSYVTYRKLRKISDEQREQARRKMLKINLDGNYRTIF